MRTIAIEAKKSNPNIQLILHSNDYQYDRYVLKSLYDNYIFSYIIKTPNHFKWKVINKILYKLYSFLKK